MAAGLADRAEVQLAYAIGVARPVSIAVDTFGTGKVAESKIVEWVRELFDLRPAGIIKMLDLRRPIYKQKPIDIPRGCPIGFFVYYNPAFAFNASARSVFSHGTSKSVRPK